MRMLLAALLLLASHSAHACAAAAYAGIAADVVTTAGAIESGRGREANPIYPRGDWFYPSLVAVAGLRAAAVRYFDTRPEPMFASQGSDGRVRLSYVSPGAYNAYNCIHAGTSWGAAGNNLAIWTGDTDRRIQYAAVGAFIIVPILAWRF